MEKLSIKPKTAKDEGDETKKNCYTCPLCNKAFINGKAFGGHKRMHSTKKKEKKPIEVINIQFYDNQPRYYKCSFCPKTLRTEKSFEEHKKTHPHPQVQREESKCVELSIIRGTSSNALVLIQDHGLVNLESSKKHNFSDLSENLPPTWARTGKRSQNARALICFPGSEEMHEIAKDLIVLSQREVRAEDLPFKKRRMVLQPIRERSNQSGETIVNYKGIRKISTSIANSTGGLKPGSSSAFICRKCNKAFVSYQALGGHNSHHKRELNKSHHRKEVDKDLNAKFSKPNCSSAKNLSDRANARWPHRCLFCNKCFQRSQALAGHRRHCKAPVPITQVAMEEVINKAIVQEPKRTLLFDLNELPPPENEDEMEHKNIEDPTDILYLAWYDGIDGPSSSSAKRSMRNNNGNILIFIILNVILGFFFLV